MIFPTFISRALLRKFHRCLYHKLSNILIFHQEFEILVFGNNFENGFKSQEIVKFSRFESIMDSAA